MGLLAFTGRLMLAGLFLMSGAMKLVHHEQGSASPIAQYLVPKLDAAQQKLHSLTGLYLPLDPEQYPNLIFVAGSLELLGGFLFTVNSKLGAVILMSVLLPTTLIMHNFWDFPEATPAHQIEFMHFVKNVSVFGAFLMFAATPRPVLLPQAKYKVA